MFSKYARSFLLGSIAVLIFAGGAGAQQRTSAAANVEKDVRAAFDRLVEGIRQANVEKVMSVYDNNDRTLFFNYNGTVTLGWQQMNENRESSYAETSNVTLDVTGVRVEILGPAAAYVSHKWKQTQEYKGKPESSTGRTTLIFKKFGKDWKVVHIHTSPDKLTETPAPDAQDEPAG